MQSMSFRNTHLSPFPPTDAALHHGTLCMIPFSFTAEIRFYHARSSCLCFLPRPKVSQPFHKKLNPLWSQSCLESLGPGSLLGPVLICHIFIRKLWSKGVAGGEGGEVGQWCHTLHLIQSEKDLHSFIQCNHSLNGARAKWLTSCIQNAAGRPLSMGLGSKWKSLE